MKHPSLSPRLDLLLDFLRNTAFDASQLFIGGDFFDFWIEWKAVIRREFFPVLCALKNLRDSGVEIHYIMGNHDFALDSFLADELGMLIHPKGFSGTVQNRKIEFLHGDGFIKSDILYNLLRGVLRNPINLSLYKMLHPSIAIPLAETVSRISRQHNGNCVNAEREKLYADTAMKHITENNLDIFFLGHLHKASIHKNGNAIYCNTGDWIEECTFARLDKGELELFRMIAPGKSEKIG